MPNSEFLIHFTSFYTKDKLFEDRNQDGLNNLLGIIEKGFKFTPRKTFTPKESENKRGAQLRIGMICFTEITKNDFAQNKEKFGNFGICMKQNWLEKYFGQPVLYSLTASYNNNLLNRLNALICKTHDLFLDTNDSRISGITSEIASLSIILQALMEPINHKHEKEWRIINDPNNEILVRDIEWWQKEEIINECSVLLPIPFLPISFGNDAEFFIMPKEYKDNFCERVINREENENKIQFIEDYI